MLSISEKDIENKVVKKLEKIGWNFEIGKNKNVFMQIPRTIEEREKLGKKRPDFILYDINSYNPLAVIETKKPGKNLEDALKQAENYAKKINVNIIFAYDGFRIRAKNILYRYKELVFGDAPISDFLDYNSLIQFKEKWKIDFQFGKKIETEKQFIEEMKKIEKILRKEGFKKGDERFTEFAKLLFLKLISQNENNVWIWEEIKKATNKNYLIDVINGNLKRLNQKYQMDKYGEKIKITSLNNIKNIIEKLSKIDFINTSLDVKGNAFEYFLNYKGKNDDLAQYFTPRKIVRFLIEISNPKPWEKVYDPFCGSGGILIKSFDYIKNQVLNKNELNFLKNKQLFGTDISTIAYVAKMNMILSGDGHTNITRQLKGSLKNKRTNQYDLVITNIPFNLDIDYNIEGIMYNIPSNNGNSIAVQHILDSLKKQKGSRATIVVPEQFIFANELKTTRQFMINNFDIKVFSLPQGVFLPYTIAKTCIIYAEYKGNKGNLEFINIDFVGFTLNRTKKSIDKNDLTKYIENDKSIKKYKLSNKDLEKNNYIFKPNFGENNGIKIGDILEYSRKNVKIDKNNNYFEITVKNHGKGIVRRVYDKKSNINKKRGSEFGSKRYIIKDEVFVYSTLDARNGGFGKINNNLIGAVYTNTYACFKLKKEYKNLDLDFLSKLLSNKDFKDHFTKISNGTTNRRSVKKEQFLETKLPYSKKELMNISNSFKKFQKKLNAINKEKEIIINEQNKLF